jgi:hypothetical protein
MSALRALALATLSLAGATARAAQDQDCAPDTLATVDAWLAKHPWKTGGTSAELRITAACKRSPVDRDVTIVVAAYARGEDDKNEIVALVDTRSYKVHATFTGVIAEDATTRVGSFGIDTARYQLAPGVRAFGVDFHSQAYVSNAAEFRREVERTLFIQDGPRLRPVLERFALTTWNAIPDTGGSGELSHWTIAVAPTRSHGLADLVVTRSTDPDLSATPLRTRAVLHFDGKSYGIDPNPGEAQALQPWPAASAAAAR